MFQNYLLPLPLYNYHLIVFLNCLKYLHHNLNFLLYCFNYLLYSDFITSSHWFSEFNMNLNQCIASWWQGCTPATVAEAWDHRHNGYAYCQCINYVNSSLNVVLRFNNLIIMGKMYQIFCTSSHCASTLYCYYSKVRNFITFSC